MNELEIRELNLSENYPIHDVSDALDKLHKHPIDNTSWLAFPYKPNVNFTIAHNCNYIFVKFYVNEKAIRAKYRNPNDPVYKDSCVEFFLSFNNEEEYYNLEFNCLGTCSFGFGKEKNNREALSEKIIKKIEYLSEIDNSFEPGICWKLTLKIPTEAFDKHQIKDLKGIMSKGNFYKCGDELPEPHYLSWNLIKSNHPNFHLPNFFGTIKFV